MRHQNTEMDIESLQRSDRRRGGCLDVFLVVSIIFLFVAVSSVAVAGVMAVMELRSKLDTSAPVQESESSRLRDTSSPAYEMQNFARLEATESKLDNYTMRWDAVKYGKDDSVGSNFVFDKSQEALELKKAGSYFMYIDLVLSCTHACSAGVLSVRLGEELTCEVELSAKLNNMSRKCWTVSQMAEKTRLLAQMTVTKVEEQNWKLELNRSGFGMFLVD